MVSRKTKSPLKMHGFPFPWGQKGAKNRKFFSNVKERKRRLSVTAATFYSFWQSEKFYKVEANDLFNEFVFVCFLFGKKQSKIFLLLLSLFSAFAFDIDILL